jgi:hypothetical protein
MISRFFSNFLFLVPCIYFVDAKAAAITLGGRAFDVVRQSSVTYHQDEGTRQFIEEDYVSLMTNYEIDQGNLRGRKLQENVDYQKKPYYQSSQQTTYGVSRAQIITLTIIVSLTVALAIYAGVLYREFAAVTLYNVLGYRVFSDPDENQGGSREQEGVEIS